MKTENENVEKQLTDEVAPEVEENVKEKEKEETVINEEADNENEQMIGTKNTGRLLLTISIIILTLLGIAYGSVYLKSSHHHHKSHKVLQDVHAATKHRVLRMRSTGRHKSPIMMRFKDNVVNKEKHSLKPKHVEKKQDHHHNKKKAKKQRKKD